MLKRDVEKCARTRTKDRPVCDNHKHSPVRKILEMIVQRSSKPLPSLSVGLPSGNLGFIAVDPRLHTLGKLLPSLVPRQPFASAKVHLAQTNVQLNLLGGHVAQNLRRL